MSEFPKMIYRKGGEAEIFGLKCETSTVESDAEEQEATTDGWHRTPFEAHGVDPPKADPVEETAPESDEKLGLLDEIDELRREMSELRTRLVAAEKERDEANKLLAEATSPPEPPKAKETLGIKQGK
jgi:hypothetical protein